MFNIFSSRSSKWKKVREEFLKRNNSCRACGKKEDLEVHHIEPVHINPSKELDTTNLITLCSNHHLVFGHLMDYKSWNVDVVNDAEVYLNKVTNRPKVIKVQNIQQNYITQLINIIKNYVKK